MNKPHLGDVTVFILSTGEDTADDCQRALQQQDCSFTVKHINNTFPMSRAFQRMPDECDTPYFVQVDSDMVLKSHAVRTLYNGIKDCPFLVYMAHGQLFEEGFGVGGAVRIWKKRLFTFFKFRDCRTVDRDLYRRVRRIGLRARNLDQVLGLHVARHSSFSNYLKAKSDIEKWRFLKRPPEQYALGRLDDIVGRLPSSSEELLGVLMGALTGKKRLERSKDIRKEDERFRKLAACLSFSDGSTISAELSMSREVLRNAFCNAYNAFSDNSGEEKEALAAIIVRTFGKDPDAESRRLIEIANF